MGNSIHGILAYVYVENVEKQIHKLDIHKQIISWQRFMDDILCLEGLNTETV